MLAEEASGEGPRKRADYTRAVDEQNDLAHKRRQAERFASLSPTERAPYMNDEYRDAFGTFGRYDKFGEYGDETRRRRT
jgi:hypothetical protein